MDPVGCGVVKTDIRLLKIMITIPLKAPTLIRPLIFIAEKIAAKYC